MPKPVNISASRGAAILGLSSWSSPVESWLKIMESIEPGFCKKNNYEYPVFEDSAVLRWGKAFESAIIELAEQKYGLNITNREQLWGYSPAMGTKCVNTTLQNNAYITCHIDGLYGVYKDNFKSPLHEGKTTSAFYFRDNFGEPGTDEVPIEYQIQCQHQIICTGADKVILSVLVFPRRVESWEEMGLIPHHIDGEGIVIHGNFHIGDMAKQLNIMGYFHQFEIKSHPELQKLMIEHYTNFWNDYVLTEKPPRPIKYNDIKALVREPVGTIVANEKVERLMSEYKQIKSEIGDAGSLSKRCDEIKTMVLEWMNDIESVIDEDTRDKWILRDRAGKKIASYGKNKNGTIIFR